MPWNQVLAAAAEQPLLIVSQRFYRQEAHRYRQIAQRSVYVGSTGK